MVELTIKERLRLMDILPVEGDILTLKAVREMREALIPTEEEEAYYDIHKVGTIIYWNDQKEPQGANVELTKRSIKVIEETLSGRNNDKNLPLELLELYERTVELEEA